MKKKMQENNADEKRFDKILKEKDIFAIAFGAMIGWGWVVICVFVFHVGPVVV